VCTTTGTNGSTVNYLAAGNCVIDANQAAGNGYAAATQVTKTIPVLPNLVGNPGFETNLTGWNTSGSDPGVTLTRVAGGHGGSWSAEILNPSSTPSTALLNDSPNWALTTAAKTYVGTLWVRSATPGAVLKLRFREYQGQTLLGTATSQITLTTSWQQVSVTYTPAQAGSTLDFNAYISKAASGTGFFADDAAISAS
jgi:Carbohydrate binding domain